MTRYVNHQERMRIIATGCIAKSFQVQKQVKSAVNFEDVNVDLKLLFLKLIYETWLVEIATEGNKSCLTQQREIKVIYNTKFSKNREI